MAIRRQNLSRGVAASILLMGIGTFTFAQSVCLPAPRLLTTMPMGGKSGTQVEIVITGEHLEDAEDLIFSDPQLTASRKLDAAGKPEPNKYVVSIAPECPIGIYEARLMTRLGISSSRIFSVSNHNEITESKPNTSLATAIELPLNSILNGSISDRSVDYVGFEAKKGQRIIVECASRGIDSKLNATVIVADSMGRDLLVERRGGVLDFSVPEDGKYVIKVHELTFKGGPAYFYRLGVWELPVGAPIVRQPATKTVNSFSWPTEGLAESAVTKETEPNNVGQAAQKISLPCDIEGGFYPAADVDVFEFEAKAGEEWWVEVVSERLGLPTDPAILVQHVDRSAGTEKLTDVAEFSDVPSPVKVSSNGYAYDGPPYNAGTSDVLGKLVIKETGLHRLQLTDLFGGTRTDDRNVYRLVIRKAAPDFALVAWALHMELRNGDRNALSKPIALRGGATMALEVIAFRRDGFDGDIEIGMEGLPGGVTAQGLKIASGQSRGMLLITAKQDAPRAYSNAKIVGRAQIQGATVSRPCRLASMSWPIPDAWNEIPSPRLLADVPVSVSGAELAPLTLAASASGPLEATAGEKLTIPLVHTRRSEFSGATMQLKAIGAGFEGVPAFDVPLTAESSQAVVDLAALKTPPGDYLIAFYGGAVAKYRHQPEAILAAESVCQKAMQELTALEAETKTATGDAVAQTAARLKAAQEALAGAKEQLKKATEAAQPRDIVDIIVSEPIAIRVKPAVPK